jgi:hypothetical protein
MVQRLIGRRSATVTTSDYKQSDHTGVAHAAGPISNRSIIRFAGYHNGNGEGGFLVFVGVMALAAGSRPS